MFIRSFYTWASNNNYSVGRAFVDDDYESKNTFTVMRLSLKSDECNYKNIFCSRL